MKKKDLMLKLKYILRFMPDELYVKLYFRMAVGRKLNLKHPKTFNEKLQWMKFNERTSFYAMLSDKCAVRDFVKERIGNQYLVKLYGAWNNPEEIDFTILPDKFVLKCNHDSGGLVICNDKSTIDYHSTIRCLNKCLKRQFYYIGREWHYKNIRPKVICEELLLDNEGNLPVDYKISCFNGKADNIMVCTGRFSKDGVKYYFFDKDWNFLRYNKGDENLPKDFTLQRPKNLEEMIIIAEKLADDLYYARIDLYNIEGRIYFSEITLCPNSGFDSDITYETDLLLGSKLNIPYSNI